MIKWTFETLIRIASWVNSHPTVATWLKERTDPGKLGPFRSWGHWAEQHPVPWVEDEQLSAVKTRICRTMAIPRNTLRIVGLSGVGKTRLVLEALGPGAGEGRKVHLSESVMYAVVGKASPEKILDTVQTLVASGTRAVLVVDRCDPETHDVLRGMALQPSSRLSLVTIDSEAPRNVAGILRKWTSWATR